LLSLFPEGGENIGAMILGSTDSAGRYSIQLDRPGTYLIQVQIIGDSAMVQDSMEYTHRVPDGEEHVFDIELPNARLSGRVLGFDGKPLPRARVSLTVEGAVGYGSFLGGRYVEVKTDAEGRYMIDYLEPGVYSVAAGGTIFGGAFGESADAGRSLRSGLVVESGDWLQDVDFRLKRPGEIRGRVVGVTGGAVQNAAIFVRDEAGRVLERFSMCMTDGTGSFSYSGVAPGKYTVSARTDDLASAESKPVVVPEDGVGNAIITLEAGTTLNVSVVDGTDGIVRAKIIVTDEDGRQVNGLASYLEILSPDKPRIFSTEEQPVGPLPPGRYTVTAIDDEDGRTVTKPVTLSGQKERRLKIRLK
jgi:hypothetical protein